MATLKYVCTTALLVSTALCAYSQDWVAPEDMKQKVAPFKFTPETHKKGEAIFKQNCASCHGNPGKGDFVKLVPPPGDPATDKFQKQVDGALFYKMTTGRNAMPSFKEVLSEEQRWLVISYIRSFNKSYVQPEPVTVSAGSFGGLKVNIALHFIPAQKLIKAVASGTKDAETKLLAGLELKLYAKRYFGKLQIDEAKITNAEGVAFFAYTNELPGDTAGNVSFEVRINAEGLNDFKKDTTLIAGKQLTAKSLIATRAMWSVRKNAPIWLILAYCGVVLTVWSFILYIVTIIFKINKLGKESKPKE